MFGHHTWVPHVPSLSKMERNEVVTMKKYIHTIVTSPHDTDTCHYLQNSMRKSLIFKKGYMTGSTYDLGHYALQEAIKADNMLVMEFLIYNSFAFLQRGCLVPPSHDGQGFCANANGSQNMNDDDDDDQPYIYTAVQYGSCECLAKLLSVHQLAANGFCKNTTFLSHALTRMCSQTELDARCVAKVDARWVAKVDTLLRHGANPLLPDANGATSLAVFCNGVREMPAESCLQGRLFAKRECRVEKNHMAHVLDRLIAAMRQHVPRLSLAQGLVWSIRTTVNPLQVPVLCGNTCLVQMLLERGVDVNAVNEEGQNAIFIQRSRTGGGTRRTHKPGERSIAYTTPLSALRLLARNGIDATRTDKCGRTPIIHLLRFFPDADMLYDKLVFLFDCGVRVQHTSHNHETALALAQALAKQNPTNFGCILELLKSMIAQENATTAGRRPATAQEHAGPWHLPARLLE